MSELTLKTVYRVSYAILHMCLGATVALGLTGNYTSGFITGLIGIAFMITGGLSMSELRRRRQWGQKYSFGQKRHPPSNWPK